MNSDKQQLINNAIIFIHSLTEVYGIDQGVELWNTIHRSVPVDIRDQIFLTMISTANGHIELKGLSMPWEEINRSKVIGCIKTHTGKTLSEIIKVLKELELGQSFSLYVEPKLVGTLRKQLSDWGIKL